MRHNCAGHFTLDALASRPVACCIMGSYDQWEFPPFFRPLVPAAVQGTMKESRKVLFIDIRKAFIYPSVWGLISPINLLYRQPIIFASNKVQYITHPQPHRRSIMRTWIQSPCRAGEIQRHVFCLVCVPHSKTVNDLLWFRSGRFITMTT